MFCTCSRICSISSFSSSAPSEICWLDGLGGERVGLAVELLREEVEALAHRRRPGRRTALDLAEVRAQARRAPRRTSTLAANSASSGAHAVVVGRAERFLQPLGELRLVGGDRLRHERRDLLDARAHRGDALARCLRRASRLRGRAPRSARRAPARQRSTAILRQRLPRRPAPRRSRRASAARRRRAAAAPRETRRAPRPRGCAGARAPRGSAAAACRRPAIRRGKTRQSTLPRETRAPICSRSAGSSARSSSAMRNCRSRKRALTERSSSASRPRGESADAAA